jgi:hypothetical protein
MRLGGSIERFRASNEMQKGSASSLLSGEGYFKHSSEDLFCPPPELRGSTLNLRSGEGYFKGPALNL